MLGLARVGVETSLFELASGLAVVVIVDRDMAGVDWTPWYNKNRINSSANHR